jgi:hypothetical protein
VKTIPERAESRATIQHNERAVSQTDLNAGRLSAITGIRTFQSARRSSRPRS